MNYLLHCSFIRENIYRPDSALGISDPFETPYGESMNEDKIFTFNIASLIVMRNSKSILKNEKK